MALNVTRLGVFIAGYLVFAVCPMADLLWDSIFDPLMWPVVVEEVLVFV